MNLNIEDPTLAALVAGLGKEIGELTTANVFMSQMIEKATTDNRSMHNLLASRDEALREKDAKLAENAALILELKSKIDPNYRGKRNADKNKRRAASAAGDYYQISD